MSFWSKLFGKEVPPVPNTPRVSTLSPDTQLRVNLLFPPEEQQVVASLLITECGNNLPFLEDLDEYHLERYRFAVLKLSEGSLDKLEKAIELAKSDWRDLLVAAEFADDVHAHRKWLPESGWAASQ